MLTDPKLRAQVDALWDKFWTGRLANLYKPPLDMFGADVVERWFNKQEIQDLIEFSNRLIA